jgi:hypothetical protein
MLIHSQFKQGMNFVAIHNHLLDLPKKQGSLRFSIRYDQTVFTITEEHRSKQIHYRNRGGLAVRSWGADSYILILATAKPPPLPMKLRERTGVIKVLDQTTRSKPLNKTGV